MNVEAGTAERLINTILEGADPAAASKDSLAQLFLAASWHGVSSEHLQLAIEALARGQLNLRVARPLLNSMIPRHHVPLDSVLVILGALSGLPESRITLKYYLIRWLVLVYEYVDDVVGLRSLTGVLLHFLEYETLRPLLSHLLFYLLDRSSITPIRVRKLLDLHRRYPLDVHVLAVLSVCRQFAPHLTATVRFASIRRSLFKSPDAKWALILQTVQQRHSGTQSTAMVTAEHNLFRRAVEYMLPSSSRRAGPVGQDRQLHLAQNKRAKINLASAATIIEPSSYTVDDIRTVGELAEKMEKVVLTSFGATLLDDRRLQHVFICIGKEAESWRLGCWVESHLARLLPSSPIASSAALSNSEQREAAAILNGLHKLAQLAQSVFPTIQDFLLSILRVWDGVFLADQVFALLAFAPPGAPNALDELMIVYIRRLFGSPRVDTKWRIRMISTLVDTLRYWACHKLRAVVRNSNNNNNDGEIEDSGANVGNEFVCNLVMAHLPQDTNVFAAMQYLVSVIDRLSVQLLGMLPKDGSEVWNAHHALLSAYETIVSLVPVYGVPIIHLPPNEVCFHIFMSSSASFISRLVAIVRDAKLISEKYAIPLPQPADDTATESDRKQPSSASTTTLSSTSAAWQSALISYIEQNDVYAHLNGLVFDFGNALWRMRAFVIDQHGVGFGIEQNEIESLDTWLNEQADFAKFYNEQYQHQQQHQQYQQQQQQQQYEAYSSQDSYALTRALTFTHCAPFANIAHRYFTERVPQQVLTGLSGPPSAKEYESIVSEMIQGKLQPPPLLLQQLPPPATYLEARMEILDTLEERGFGGVTRFLQSNITALAKRATKTSLSSHQQQS